jgi:hypothetical protein
MGRNMASNYKKNQIQSTMIFVSHKFFNIKCIHDYEQLFEFQILSVNIHYQHCTLKVA